ncbi:MAG TPA: hypothetical protein VLC09_20280 [Polyangiaceae bacterium]|nr:hypothetical protein [Polyangiaceae bacterium]
MRWAVAAAIACFTAEGASTEASGHPPTSASPLASSPADGEGVQQFSGTYVMLQQTVTRAELPVIADIEATTRAVSLLQLRHDGSRLFGSGPVCALEMQNDSSLVTTELPEAFRRSLPPVEVDARLVATERGLAFRQPERTIVVGARVLPGAPLPSSASDKRVFDQDGDGKPGVTVRVSVRGILAGDIYLVQRSRSRLYGSQRGSAFTGRIDFENEQRVLGSSHPLLGDGPVSRPLPERSFFRLERIQEGADCAAAVRRAQGWR